MASVSSIPIATQSQMDNLSSSFTSKATNNTAPSINSIIKHAKELGIDMTYSEAQLIAAGVSESNNNGMPADNNGSSEHHSESRPENITVESILRNSANISLKPKEIQAITADIPLSPPDDIPLSPNELEEEQSIALNSMNSTLDTNVTPFKPATRRGSTTGFNISALTLDTNMDPLTPQSAAGGKQQINALGIQSDLPFGATASSGAGQGARERRRGSVEEERLGTHLETSQESTGHSATTNTPDPIDTQSESPPPSTLQKITNSDVTSLPNFYPRGIGDDVSMSSSKASSKYSKAPSVMSKYSHRSSASCISKDSYSVASQSYYTIQSQYSKVSRAGSRQSVRRREMYNSTLNVDDLKEDKSEATKESEDKEEESHATEESVENMERSEPMLSVANSEETPRSSSGGGGGRTTDSNEKTTESYEKSDTDLLLNEAASVLKEKIRRLSGDKLSTGQQGRAILLCQEIKPALANDHEDIQSEAASTNYYDGTQGSLTHHDGSLDIEDEDTLNSKALVLFDQSGNNQSYGQSGVTDESPTSVTDTASLDNDSTTSSNHQHSQALVLHSSKQQQQQQQHSRGIEPTEIIHNKAFLHIDGPNDPPGESPNDCPVVCMDIIPHNTTTTNNSRGRGWEATTDAPSAYSGRSNDSGRSSDPGGSYHSGDDSGKGGRRRWSNVTWVDPKTIQNENDIDYNVLRQYETLTGCNGVENSQPYEGEESRALVVAVDPPSAPSTEYSSTSSSPTSFSNTPSILSNPRTRIATISSGYKKANYFVREDLDTRIYFHQIEDAIGYMAKRGYCKMRGEEEKEWKMLLGKAHGVIKGGGKKKVKQRYRKGKLVMILKKTITDTPAAADPYVDTVAKPKKKTKKKKKTRSSSSTISSSQDTQSTSTECSSSLYSSQSTDTSVQTSRTSLGKTIRGTYKSYSEKFLAQQEEEKQRCLLAIMEGVPADELNVYGNDNVVGKQQLLLTDGSDHYDGPIDAPSEYGDETTTSGASTYNSKDDFEKSRHTVASNRRGVYGGGVCTFTPDNGGYDDDESEDEGTEEVCYEDSEEEENVEEDDDVDEYTSQDEYDEEDDTGGGGGGGESDTIELEGSDMESMFSAEDTYDHHQHSVGVESISGVDSISDSTMSTAEQNERHYSGGKSGSSGKRRGGKRRGHPPKMTTISDNSVSTSNS